MRTVPHGSEFTESSAGSVSVVRRTGRAGAGAGAGGCGPIGWPAGGGRGGCPPPAPRPAPPRRPRASASADQRLAATPLRGGGAAGGGATKRRGPACFLRFGRELGYSIPSRPDGSGAVGALGASPIPARAAND